MREKLSAIEADITTLAIDAIVNAANEALIRGGGVDGAIRRKAGEEIEVELRRFGCCPTGQAVITRGHRLPARFVIHTVAPIWGAHAGSREDSIRLLADCYRHTLMIARENAIGEIAFPCIGTGIYGWPAELATETAFDAVTGFLRDDSGIARVVFCCFSEADRNRYTARIAALP